MNFQRLIAGVWLVLLTAFPNLSAAANPYFSFDLDEIKASIRDFTARHAPAGTAAQQEFYGLLLPGGEIAETKPMVVLIHGLDCNRRNWSAMTQLLMDEGFQVGYFTYPSDQPLYDSAELLSRHMTALRQAFGRVPVNVIAHSMGALVAREYIEGPTYAGGIERLILIAPPNQGSTWASYRLFLEAEEHYYLWRDEPNWRWTWMITDGLGEAGRDLKPDSVFLTKLNERPRRADVKYTIIAGSQHPGYRMASNALVYTAKCIPDRFSHWWGVRQTDRALKRGAKKLDRHVSDCDGPVALQSTQLEGVKDVVILKGDQTSLYYGLGDDPPVAWETVRDRLRK